MKMSKKRKKIVDFLVDGKRVKQIVKKKEDGTDEWIMFKAIDTEGIDSGFHFVVGKPEEHHRDVYVDGKKTLYKDSKGRVEPAGVAIVPTAKGKEFITLPPLEVPVEELNNKPIPERLHEYIKKVKIVKIKN